MLSFINLLGVGPGAFVYHLMVIMALQAMAGIALIEWRQTRNPDHRRVLSAFGGVILLRIPILVGGVALEAALSPAIRILLVNGLATVSLCLMGWAFLAASLSRAWRRAYLIGGGSLVLVGAILSLPFGGSQTLYLAFWREPIWRAIQVAVVLAAAAILAFRPRGEKPWLPIGGFAMLALGTIFLFLATLLQTLGVVQAPGAATLIGVGRLTNLIGYPFFAVAVYRSALENMWAYRDELKSVSQEALRQAQELHFLAEAGRTIGESLNLEVILQQLAESAAMALDADRAAVFLTGGDGEKDVRLAAQYASLQRGEGRIDPSRIDLAQQPTLEYGLQRGKQLMLNSEHDNPRLKTLYDLLGTRRAGPTIVQPLIHQRRTLGVLIVGNDYSQRAFEPSDGRLCQSLAAQVTAAVENARLYRDLQAQAGKLAELLQAQEEEVRRRTAILESIAEGVIVGDDAGRVMIVNAAAERILGVSRRRLLGRSLAGFASHVSPDRRADWRSFAQPESPLQTVFALDGRVVHVNAAPVQMPTGDHIGVVAVLRDVTKEQEAERAKEEFITAISHELRTPLTAIRGYAELLGGGVAGSVTDSQSHFLRVIRDNGLRMVRLTENLITVSQLDKGGVELDYGEADVQLILNGVVRAARRELAERQLALDLDLAPDMPVIEADPSRVRQIVDNLLSNAIRFTPPEGRIEVGGARVEAEGGADWCRIWVTDTGIGIHPREQSRVWTRFYKSPDPLAAEGSGLGVGLSIAKALTEAHGGHVDLESAPGEGSTFTVLLPVCRTSA